MDRDIVLVNLYKQIKEKEIEFNNPIFQEIIDELIK